MTPYTASKCAQAAINWSETSPLTITEVTRHFEWRPLVHPIIPELKNTHSHVPRPPATRSRPQTFSAHIANWIALGSRTTCSLQLLSVDTPRSTCKMFKFSRQGSALSCRRTRNTRVSATTLRLRSATPAATCRRARKFRLRSSRSLPAAAVTPGVTRQRSCRRSRSCPTEFAADVRCSCATWRAGSETTPAKQHNHRRRVNVSWPSHTYDSMQQRFVMRATTSTYRYHKKVTASVLVVPICSSVSYLWQAVFTFSTFNYTYLYLITDICN